MGIKKSTDTDHDGKTHSATIGHGKNEGVHSDGSGLREEMRQEAHLAREEKRKKDRDILAKEEPNVLESSEYDPEFPAMSEFEVDEGGFKGSKSKHPGLIWIIVAIVAVAALVIAFMCAGDWMNPTQAEQEAQVQFEEQTVPEDLGAN